MWYTLPWAFDGFFHEYVPYQWITGMHVFERPSSHETRTINQSSLLTLDASSPTLSSPIFFLPHILLLDRIETFHLSYYNEPISLPLSRLRHVTLVNSINCLNYYSSFPASVRSIRILLFYNYPNCVRPKWPMVLYSLSTMQQLTSLRVFMYDMLVSTMDDESCQLIAKVAPLFIDFGFCFRRKYSLRDGDELTNDFNGHMKFIRHLRDYILLFHEKKPFYAIEKDECGLILWF
jgi:hypothetical protein